MEDYKEQIAKYGFFIVDKKVTNELVTEMSNIFHIMYFKEKIVNNILDSKFFSNENSYNRFITKNKEN